MTVLVTGASGFIGQQLISYLHSKKIKFSCVSRKKLPEFDAAVHHYNLQSDSSEKSWIDVVRHYDCIIHLSGRAHIMQDEVEAPLTAYRRVNTEHTLKLAEIAAANGVRRFVFLSSIKVNGESTLRNSPFIENSTMIPVDPYGLSKYEAEQGLMEIAQRTEMEVVIIRPPLVYGPNVKANFRMLINLVLGPLPLPLANIRNLRSFIAIDNLIDFLVRCIDHPKAKNQVFLISDNDDISTTNLLMKIAKAYKVNLRLVPIPTSLITIVLKLVGKKQISERLFGSLQVDCNKARETLSWEPIVTMEQQLEKMAIVEQKSKND